MALHLDRTKLSWQLPAEVVEQDFLVCGGLRDAASADLSAVFRGQDDVDRAEFTDFIQHAPWFVSESRFRAQLAQEFPQDIGQEARSEERRVGKECRL